MNKNLREELNKLISLNSDGLNELIAQNILSFINDGVKPSINDISEKSFTNKSTITRFCKYLGFSGYKDFIELLMLQEKKYYIKDEVSFNNSFEDYKNELSKVINNLDYSFEFVDEITDLFLTQRIFVFSSYENNILTRLFSSQMQSLGVQLFFNESLHQQLLINNIQDDDVVLFVVSGSDNSTLVKIYNHISLKNRCFIISTSSQIDKFPGTYKNIVLNIGTTLMRENLKQISFNYLFDQMKINLLNKSRDFQIKITNPKFKF